MTAEPHAAPAVEPPPGRAGKWSELFGIERRSLACFRIGLGALLLWDLYGRARTLRMHYTGEGAYPRALALLEERPRPDFFRVFMLSDSVAVQAILFGLFALLAVLLVVGWRTRIVSVLAFVFLASLIRRNQWVCHTGDMWLLTLLFWAMFLPLGAHFSLDGLRGHVRATRARVLGPATAGALLQVALFYVVAGYLKSRYDVWTRGDAVWVFTHAVEYTRPFGAWLGQFPAACRFLSLATLALEGLAPFLLFLPFATARIRTVLFLLFAAFHLTLQSTIHIGIFQLTCIVALTLLLPGSFWDGLARRVPAGVRARWGELVTAVPRRFGRAARPRREPRGAAVLATGAFLALAFAVVLVSNVNTAARDPYDRADKGPLPLPAWLDGPARQLSLVQNWNMFTDIDRLFFGWFLVLGQQEDGRHVDVLARTPFDGVRRPEHYARYFPNHNARRHWREMAQPGREFLQKPLCDALAREWEHEGRPPLTHLALFHVGRVPSRGATLDQVKGVADQWEAPHEPLKDAAPAVRQLWTERRARWREFLETLPKTVPARE